MENSFRRKGENLFKNIFFSLSHLSAIVYLALDFGEMPSNVLLYTDSYMWIVCERIWPR